MERNEVLKQLVFLAGLFAIGGFTTESNELMQIVLEESPSEITLPSWADDLSLVTSS